MLISLHSLIFIHIYIVQKPETDKKMVNGYEYLQWNDYKRQHGHCIYSFSTNPSKLISILVVITYTQYIIFFVLHSSDFLTYIELIQSACEHWTVGVLLIFMSISMFFNCKQTIWAVIKVHSYDRWTKTQKFNQMKV